MGVRRPFEGNIARMGLLMVVRDQLIAFGDTSAEVGRAKSGRALGGWGGVLSWKEAVWTSAEAVHSSDDGEGRFRTSGPWKEELSDFHLQSGQWLPKL